MSLIHLFIRTNPSDILQRIDDVCDHRSMTREEALDFLERLVAEIVIRIDLVQSEIRRREREADDGNDGT